MAWTFQLENSTTSLNLNDGTSYKIMPRGFDAPPPPLRGIYAGAGNMFRAGSRLVRQSYDNRIVTLGIQISGATTDALAANIEAIETYMRLAPEFSSLGMGSQVKLKYQWDSASNPVYFHVITGQFSPIVASQHDEMLIINTKIMNASLSLVCEPFAFGAQQSIQNYVRNASFEVAGTALADWTQSITATGSTARSTAASKFGNASLLLTMTNSGGSGQVVERNQTLADVDAAEVWSFSAWIHLTALSNSKAGLVVLYNDGSATTATSYVTSTNSDFAQVTIANQTVPSGATQAIVKVRLESTAGSATGTAYVDGVMAVQTATAPSVFVSSYEVMNHHADDSQLTTNVLDIENVPGNQPALLQVRATENEAHTKFWMGARHGSRQHDSGLFHEGEALTGDRLVDNADAACSDGNETRSHRTPAHVATGSDGSTGANLTASVAVSGLNRALVAFVGGSNTSGTSVISPTSVVFNGDETMTSIHTVASGTNRTLSLYYLANPTATTANVVATYGATTNQSQIMVASAYQYCDSVDASIYEALASTAWSSADTVSQAFTTTKGDTVVWGSFLGTAEAHTPGGGLTERADLQETGCTMATGDLVADATTETPSFSYSTSSNRGAVGFVLSAAADTPALPDVATVAITTPPRGQFRVLARVDGQTGVWSLGAGYSYGDISYTPSVANDYPATTSGVAGYEILDLGTITIPPIGVPENATIGALTLRVAYYMSTTGESKTLDIDWVQLLPIDFGSMYVSKSSGTDVILVDSLSEVRSAVLVDASDVVQSIPSTQGGDPPTVHPDGTRLYFAGVSADIDDGWKLKVTLEPRFLSVAGT